MTQDSGQTLTHYRLIEKIGEGGMGVVWKAEDTILNRTVAIKTLPHDASRDERRREMFLDEARLASSLSDAHIVQVFELGREGDLDFIVMEYVKGKPLSKILHGRPLPPDKVAELGLQVARALAKAHRRGLIHRDIKPANILVTADGEVKVVDFGLAALFDPRGAGSAGPDEPTLEGSRAPADLSARDAVHSRRGEMGGTLPYMAPEQVRRERLDTRSDVYSLGVVLYEMTTGQKPFEAATSGELAEAIVRCRPKAAHDVVPKVPLDLDRIIHKALAAKPAERYQTMEDLAVDLKRLGKELESGSSPSYESLQAGAPPRRWKVAAGVVGAGFVAAAIGLTVWQRGWIAGTPPHDERTILVLPFEVRGQEEGAEYVGRAFAEALVVELSQSPELTVLPVPVERPGTEGGLLEPAVAGRASGAGRVLMGALTREGEGVRASASLVDSAGNRVVWGAAREERTGDLSALASAIAGNLRQKLAVSLPAHYGDPVESLLSGPAAAMPEAAEFIGAYERADYQGAQAAAEGLVEAFPREVAAQAALRNCE